jgi:hypothetical protein
VTAEVTSRPRARSAAIADASLSRRAATTALDSRYRRAGTASSGRRTAEWAGLALRFAAVTVDQLCSSSSGEPNLRPLLERVTSLECWSDHTCPDQLLVSTPPASDRRLRRRNKFRHHPAMHRNRDALARLQRGLTLGLSIQRSTRASALGVAGDRHDVVEDARGGHVRSGAGAGHHQRPLRISLGVDHHLVVGAM